MQGDSGWELWRRIRRELPVFAPLPFPVGPGWVGYIGFEMAPGVIEVFDMDALRLIQTVPTGSGAHTMAFDSLRNKVYAILPQTHSVAVFVDRD